MRIIVTGGRSITAEQGQALIWNTLDIVTVNQAPEDMVIVQGECHLGGADLIARNWADAHGVRVESYPASDFGSWPACGPRRNAHMVSLDADLCVGFPEPGSKGTWDCLAKAVNAGIPVRVRAVFP